MIRIERLTKRYAGTDRPAVDDLSVDIPAGAFFTLLGPSGCGKSSTLRCVAGLERPDGGTIAIRDTTVFSSSRGINVPPHRRALGMVFQSYAVWPHMTVHGNVAYPLKNRGKSRSEIDEAVRWVLRLVGLERLAARPAPFLSGGEQQRVALARALVEHPSVLLLDEPLSNLDAKLREEMRVELRDLQQKLGFTAVYVTHDQDEAFALSDVMAVMNHGRIVEMGPPEEVYQAPRTEFGAEFVGAATKLTGTVAGSEGSEVLRVLTPIGIMRCRCRVRLPQAARVAVYVRPEEIQPVGDLSPADALTVDARIERAAFMGGALDWTAEVDGILLRARSLVGTLDSRTIQQSTQKILRISISTSRCVPLGAAQAVPGDGVSPDRASRS
jgi:iron(III) transport system ATP-binding protein